MGFRRRRLRLVARAAARPAALTGPGAGQLTAVARGPAGWLAVGTTLADGGGALVASSADARTWTVAEGIAGSGGQGTVAAAVAAGPAGYVVVGHRSAGPGGGRRRRRLVHQRLHRRLPAAGTAPA